MNHLATCFSCELFLYLRIEDVLGEVSLKRKELNYSICIFRSIMPSSKWNVSSTALIVPESSYFDMRILAN